MNDLLDLLTSSEAGIVYIVIGIASVLCFIIYLVDRNRVKARQKHNTKELNKLVEKIQEEGIVTETKVTYDKPVMETVKTSNSSTSVDDMLQYTAALYKNTYEEEEDIEEVPQIIETKPLVIDPIDIEEEIVDVNVPEKVEVKLPEPIEVEVPKTVNMKLPEIVLPEELEEETVEEIETTTETLETEIPEVLEVKTPEVQLQYTDIELNQEEAKKELQQLTEELQHETKIENEMHTSFEEEQEQTAIISLQELLEKSKTMYETNELTQYADENTVPISIGELEEQVGRESTQYKDSFVLENVVPEEEETTIETTVETIVETTTEEDNKKFKSSPIISPVFGIERQSNMQLENTANYEKFDAEVKKTNEFLMTLKELQENIE